MAHNDPASAGIHETDADARERDAFNAAFRELGLRWHWDAAIFGELKHIAEDGERIRTYLETHQPHLLKAYDAPFLVDAVRSAKASASATTAGRGRRSADCADFATAQTGF